MLDNWAAFDRRRGGCDRPTRLHSLRLHSRTLLSLSRRLTTSRCSGLTHRLKIELLLLLDGRLTRLLYLRRVDMLGLWKIGIV